MGERDDYLTAILAGDRGSALRIAHGLVEDGAPVLDVYADVLQEALYEVGRLWESHRISVATEHIATAVTQLVLARLYENLPRRAAFRGRVVLTGIEGELHQVGGQMVSDALETDGWEVVYLGTDVPLPDVVDSVATLRPEVLGVSCTISRNLPKVAALVAAVRESLGARAPKVLVGGGAFLGSPSDAEKVGADLFAPDLRAAVAALRAPAAGG